MTLRLRVYAIATLLTVGTFGVVAHFIVQILNGLFGHPTPSHYNVTKLL
jgi:hypothetical protein